MPTTDSPFYFGAYWGARREPVGSCSRRLERYLETLRSTDPALATWVTKPTRRRPSSPIATDESSLRDILLAGRNRTDFGDEMLEELGFTLAVWNGDRDTEIGMSVTCGLWADHRGLVNSVVLRLPTVAECPSLFVPETARAIVTGAVESWAPDWAILTNYEIADVVDSGGPEPAIGWITFLGASRPVPEPLPGHAQAHKIPQGTISTATDRLELVTPGQVADLRAALHAAGALGPTL